MGLDYRLVLIETGTLTARPRSCSAVRFLARWLLKYDRIFNVTQQLSVDDVIALRVASARWLYGFGRFSSLSFSLRLPDCLVT